MVDMDIQIKRTVTFADKYCKTCNNLNWFKYNRSTQGISSSCLKCQEIAIKDANDAIKEFQKKILKYENSIADILESKSVIAQKDNLFFCIENLMKTIFNQGHAPFDQFRKMKCLFNSNFLYSKGNDDKISKNEFLNFFKAVHQIEICKENIRNIEKESMKVDTKGESYYSYGYCRLIDSLGEMGIGTRKDVQNKIEELYSNSLNSQFESELGTSTSLLDLYLNEDHYILEFYSGFYYALQMYKDERDFLNLYWIRDIDLNASNLKKWRSDIFKEYPNGISTLHVKNSLKNEFGAEKASIILENLVLSESNIRPFIYMVEFKEEVFLMPIWAAWIEVFLQAEKDGDEVFKNWNEDKANHFEKEIIPNKFKEEGFLVGSGFKVLNPDGTMKYQYDSVVLSPSKTLWIVEAKHLKLKRRQMDRFNSWKKECENYIDIPKKTFSFLDKVRYIKKNLDLLRNIGQIPSDWKINQIKGVVVTNLPPIEEEYKGIPIIWYRELDIFCNISSNL